MRDKRRNRVAICTWSASAGPHPAGSGKQHGKQSRSDSTNAAVAETCYTSQCTVSSHSSRHVRDYDDEWYRTGKAVCSCSGRTGLESWLGHRISWQRFPQSLQTTARIVPRLATAICLDILQNSSLIINLALIVLLLNVSLHEAWQGSYNSTNITNKLRGRRPEANYTDRGTGACQWS
jgi:hypothetical protein